MVGRLSPGEPARPVPVKGVAKPPDRTLGAFPVPGATLLACQAGNRVVGQFQTDPLPKRGIRPVAS